MSKKKDYLTRTEAAEYLGVHPETLRRIVNRGDLVRYSIGRKLWFRREDLDQYLTPKLSA